MMPTSMTAALGVSMATAAMTWAALLIQGDDLPHRYAVALGVLGFVASMVCGFIGGWLLAR